MESNCYISIILPLFNPHIICQKGQQWQQRHQRIFTNGSIYESNTKTSMWFVKSFAAETLHPENPWL